MVLKQTINKFFALKKKARRLEEATEKGLQFLRPEKKARFMRKNLMNLAFAL